MYCLTTQECPAGIERHDVHYYCYQSCHIILRSLVKINPAFPSSAVVINYEDILCHLSLLTWPN